MKTQLNFDFPCPLLWLEILKQKQIAEQRDRKNLVLQDIKKYKPQPYSSYNEEEVEKLWEEEGYGWENSEQADTAEMFAWHNFNVYEEREHMRSVLCNAFNKVQEGYELTEKIKGDLRIEHTEFFDEYLFEYSHASKKNKIRYNLDNSNKRIKKVVNFTYKGAVLKYVFYQVPFILE